MTSEPHQSRVVQTGTSVIAPGLSVTVFCGAVGRGHPGPSEIDYERFIEGLTAKLNAAGVPAMPSWPEAIDWLIDSVAERDRLRALLKQAHDRDKWVGECPTIEWYDDVARYFEGKCP